jgi:hypothetical protein
MSVALAEPVGVVVDHRFVYFEIKNRETQEIRSSWEK